MTETLTMHDGTQLYGSAEQRKKDLYLYVYGKTRQEVNEILSDPGKTETIISERNDGTHIYEGYTEMKEIVEVSDRFITATMRLKEEEEGGDDK